MAPIQDRSLDWFLCMKDSTDYLGIEQLQANMAYAIWARNAYVGIWLPVEQGFLISRYKMNPKPYLFVEYHWDTGEPNGTVKPLHPLEFCPLPLPLVQKLADLDGKSNALLCAWLDALEEKHPPLSGWNSIAERREDVARFRSRH